MIVMRQSAAMITVLVFLLSAGACFADGYAIPNMVGTWTVKAEGGVLLKDSAPRLQTHHAGEFSSLTAEAVVAKQQGRVFCGIFKSARATEKFIGVISLDNRSFYYADEDGFMEGKFVGKNKIEVVYRHTTVSDTVIAGYVDKEEVEAP